VPGKGFPVQGWIRRPEERIFKTLCIYFIDSCNKILTETPVVFLVEVFKVHG